MVETYDTTIKETIELSVWLNRLTARFEENKEKLRQYSKGEKSNFCLPGIGNILVSARRTKLLRADIIIIYDQNPNRIIRLENNGSQSFNEHEITELFTVTDFYCTSF